MYLIILKQLSVNFMVDFKIKSSVFENNKLIPKKYTCDGDEINPPLSIEGTPKGTKTLVLIMDDPDAPGGTFDHWIVWNIPASTVTVNENSAPGTEGLNSGGRRGYYGPCPPSGTHRYFFKLYALDCELKSGPSSRKKDVEKAFSGHVLAETKLVGLYRR